MNLPDYILNCQITITQRVNPEENKKDIKNTD